MQKGFTLIEVMIVFILVGILAAISIPRYQEYIAISYGASAMNGVSNHIINLQICILDANPCTSINNIVARIPELSSTPVPIAANNNATLTYDNSVCNVTATIDRNGTLSYSADTSNAARATQEQCKKGAKLN